MKKLITTIALGLAAVSCAPTPSYATFPIAPITADVVAPAVNEPVTYDVTATCPTATCSYVWSWQYLYKGAYKVGGQMGYGQTVVYAFPASAASKPYVLVVVKVTASNGTNNYALAQRAVIVSP